MSHSGCTSDSLTLGFCMSCNEVFTLGQLRRIHTKIQEVNKSCGQILHSFWSVQGVISPECWICQSCMQILCSIEKADLTLFMKKQEFEMRLMVSSPLGEILQRKDTHHKEELQSKKVVQTTGFCMSCIEEFRRGNRRSNIHSLIEVVDKSCWQILHSFWSVQGVIPPDGYICQSCMQILSSVEKADLVLRTQKREFEKRLKLSSALGQMLQRKDVHDEVAQPGFCMTCNEEFRLGQCGIQVVLAEVGKSCVEILKSFWCVQGSIPPNGRICESCLQMLCSLERAWFRFSKKKQEFEMRLKASSTLGQMMQHKNMHQEEENQKEEVQTINSHNETLSGIADPQREITGLVINYMKNNQPDHALRALIKLPEASQEMRKIVQSVTRREIATLDQTKRGKARSEKIAELHGFSLQQQATDMQKSCPILYSALEGALSSLENGCYLMGSIMFQMLQAQRPNQIWTMQCINSIMMWLLGCRPEMFAKFNLAGWCMGIKATNHFIDRLVANQDNDLVRLKQQVEEQTNGTSNKDLDIGAMEARVIRFLGKKIESAFSSAQKSTAEENKPEKVTTPTSDVHVPPAPAGEEKEPEKVMASTTVTDVHMSPAKEEKEPAKVTSDVHIPPVPANEEKEPDKVMASTTVTDVHMSPAKEEKEPAKGEI
ncbi:uncharacterized protein [Amphiura filiformis]|uniref:uncharacterized protein n=1 Tax=Amphiura filiformis TaxID=82378 RepID=UPI003B21633F